MNTAHILRGPSRPDLLRDETLADILEATAHACPKKIALIFAEQSLNYAELNRRADVVAHHLIERGVRPGNIVGLWMPRGIDCLVAQAGIAKAGAAWLPLDIDTPPERITICLADARAVGLIAQHDLVVLLGEMKTAVWTSAELNVAVDAPLRRREGLLPAHPAYVIYTSGSTGKPKGIAISQGSICHFLRSENSVLGVNRNDRVYQGFSVAFDMSFEEIWISYLVGATLWIAPKELVGDPQALPIALTNAGITVLHAVPTLLALFSEDIPSLRIINLGGEMCPETLVEKWSRPGRQMFNTYGPTEATVSASLAELRRGEPITIGMPLPNYGLAVIDSELNALPIGATGELCIFGRGVADGYLGRPELTREKFIANPFAQSADEARLYRTGDLARIDADGNVQCLGRADDQVKIRGFRVELGEIEATLSDQPGVGTVAVVLRKHNNIDLLVAYIVAQSGTHVVASTLREALQKLLPSYMIPAVFEFIDEMPRLTSGKIDRNALRARPFAPAIDTSESDRPGNEAEAALLDALQKLFPGQPIHFRADFFTDLGGHSLLAAGLVSMLRAQPRFAELTVQTIYQRRTVGAIAEVMSATRRNESARTEENSAVAPIPWQRRIACGIAQSLALPILICLRMLHWLAPFFIYHYLTGDVNDSVRFAVAASIGVFLLGQLFGFAVAIVARRVLLLGLKPGSYPLWGATYFRWWLADRLAEIAPVHLISGSPLLSAYLRAMGARIGSDVVIGSLHVRVPAFLEIGDGASIGTSVNFENARVERGQLLLGKITLGREAYVGSYAVLEGNTRLEEFAHLEGLSSLGENLTIPAGEVWDGSPARRVDTEDIAKCAPRPHVSFRRKLFEALFYTAGAALFSALFFMPLFPTFILVDWLDGLWLDPSLEDQGSLVVAGQYFLLALPASGLLVILTALLSAAVRWIALPRLVPGTYPVHGGIYYRKWLANQIQEASLQILHGIYATIYSPWWYRLLGAKVGRHAEISTAMGVIPDMLTLGDETFIADAVILGDEEIKGGWMTLQPTSIGARSFVGNGGYVPDGTVLPPNVLIGVQSKAPPNAKMHAGQTWVGSPAVELPAREVVLGFADALTFQPSLPRFIGRGLVEAARIVLPLAFIIGVGYLTVLKIIPSAASKQWGLFLAQLSFAGLLFGVGSFVSVVLLKWLLIGRYTPRAAPMWTPFVWISEAITNVYEALAVPNFLTFFLGTPMLPALLRLLGCKIGRGVYLDTTDFTEYDCVTIGDHSELNAWSGPQTHLFEDRVMKIGRVEIGAHVTVGARSTILYNARVSDGATLGPLTLVMKGELIPPYTDWIGSPAIARAPVSGG